MERIGLPTSVSLLVVFALVCLAEVAVGMMLLLDLPLAVTISYLLLPLEFVFWIGFARRSARHSASPELFCCCSRESPSSQARAGGVAVIYTRTATGVPNDAVLASRDQIGAYRVAEFVTLACDGSPVGWPLNPDREGDRLVFSNGYVYPGKARNAQRDPRVAVLYSDPTASGRTDADPLVLVQGRCEILDRDLQANTERYVAQHGARLAPGSEPRALLNSHRPSAGLPQRLRQ